MCIMLQYYVLLIYFHGKINKVVTAQSHMVAVMVVDDIRDH